MNRSSGSIWPIGLALTAALTASTLAHAGNLVSTSQIVRACAAEGGRRTPAVSGIDIKTMPAAPGDLPFIQVTNRRSGATVRIYHQPALLRVARARAACFGGLTALLQPVIPDPRQGVPWAPIVLTRDPNYVPPRSETEHRWIVPGFSGAWDASAISFLVLVMPHEETHNSQIALRATRLPRWFQEGHAEWAGLHVTEVVRPDLATAQRRAHDKALIERPDAHLGAWGGRRVKPEAIDRQISPADRERRRREPDWSPPGPFSFGPGDFVDDNDKEASRYAAALALFDGLEQRHGHAAVQAWATAVLKNTDNKAIVPLAKDILGEDIAPLLH